MSRLASQGSCRAWRNGAGATAATCVSMFDGVRPIPTAAADTRPNWLRSRRMSSSPIPVRSWRRYSRRPKWCRLYSRGLSTRSAPASSRTWHGRAGTRPGFASLDYGTSGKWLELLKEIAPRVTRAAILRDPTIAAGIGQLAAIQAVAPALGVELSPLGARDVSEIERALAAFPPGANAGLIVTAGPSTGTHRDLIIAFAARHRLPTVYPFRYHVASGGLISYGPDSLYGFRPAAGYVDRILKGEKPADLPVQAATKYELVNLKTAKTLGLDVPASVLARADEVIE